MSSLNKGVARVQAQLRWDPSPPGAAATDLDLVAATFRADGPSGDPAYLVHFDSRSPDGTIWLDRDSRTGQGLGYDEVMTLDLTRLSPAYGRVVVGAAIQQHAGRVVFADVRNPGFRVVEGYTVLAEGDFAAVAGATAATVAEFTRNASGEWEFHPLLRGFDADPETFARTMGRPAG